MWATKMQLVFARVNHIKVSNRLNQYIIISIVKQVGKFQSGGTTLSVTKMWFWVLPNMKYNFECYQIWSTF